MDAIKLINIARYNKLKYLNLSKFNLTTLPLELATLSDTLEELILDYNQLEKFDYDFFSDFKKLRLLSIKYNYLTEFKIPPLENLKILSLKGNILQEFPQDILRLKNLEELSIARNRISKIPKDIDRLRNLKVFFADGNQISELPHSLANLSNLLAFTITENPVARNIPGGLCHFVGIDRVKNFFISRSLVLQMYNDMYTAKEYYDRLLEENLSNKNWSKFFYDNYRQVNRIRQIAENNRTAFEKMINTYALQYNQNLQVTDNRLMLLMYEYFNMNNGYFLEEVLPLSYDVIRKYRSQLGEILQKIYKVKEHKTFRQLLPYLRRDIEKLYNITE